MLSGGCFQNRYLTERAVKRLREEGFRPYWHQRVPPNDGGIALGQVAAVSRMKSKLTKEERPVVMCLAVPGKILSVSGEDFARTARVSFGGIVKEVSLAYVPGGARRRIRDRACWLCHQRGG